MKILIEIWRSCCGYFFHGDTFGDVENLIETLRSHYKDYLRCHLRHEEGCFFYSKSPKDKDSVLKLFDLW